MPARFCGVLKLISISTRPSIPAPGDPLAELEERIAREVVTTKSLRCDTDVSLEEIAPLLERSNVDVVSELVRLITAQRAYEINTKSITIADKMLQQSNNLIR